MNIFKYISGEPQADRAHSQAPGWGIRKAGLFGRGGGDSPTGHCWATSRREYIVPFEEWAEALSSAEFSTHVKFASPLLYDLFIFYIFRGAGKKLAHTGFHRRQASLLSDKSREDFFWELLGKSSAQIIV